MLLVLKYGYKQSKLFNIDCILGNLLDTVKHEALTETIRTLKEAETKWKTTISELDEKISQLSAKIATKREGDSKDVSSMSTLPAPTKPGPNTNQKQTAKENDIINLKNQLENLERQVTGYREKISKIELRLHEIESYVKEDDLKLWDLADYTGERLFVTRKLDQRAKTIVIPNKPYYIVRLDSADNPNAQMQPLVVDGYLVLGLDDEGGKVADLNMFASKKSVKGR
jgi:hypothetical protein